MLVLPIPIYLESASITIAVTIPIAYSNAISIVRERFQFGSRF